MDPVVVVAGARPNFMKVAPILRAVDARGGPFPITLVHTGQHYDAAMSDVFFAQLGLRPPDVHLGVGSAAHGEQTARVMIAFERYLLGLDRRPAAVVVVGDVNSTLACALVAAKLTIPVAHVEAGLRSFDRSMPEEINRLVTDAVADLLLVSEPAGLDNLAREGIPSHRVVYVGNVMIDTLVHQLPAARALELPRQLGVGRGGYALVTLHRPSNVDAAPRLAAVVALLERLAAALPVVFPIHPRTAARLDAHGLRARLDAAGLRCLAPVGYRESLALIDGARLVVTDSGGIQEETTYLGVPCVTLRPNTERPITVSAGTNAVVGEDLDRAWQAVAAALDGRAPTGRPIDGWDGRAAERVVDAVLAAWGR